MKNLKENLVFIIEEIFMCKWIKDKIYKSYYKLVERVDVFFVLSGR